MLFKMFNIMQLPIKWSFLFIVALLISFGFTTWYVTEYEPYEVIGDEWLTNSNFNQGLEGWKATKNAQVMQRHSGVLALSTVASGKNAILYQRVTIPPPFSLPVQEYVKKNTEQNTDLTPDTNASNTAMNAMSHPAPLLLQLSGFARTKNIEKGERPWHQGRLALVFYNKSGNSRVTHAIPLPSGSSEWAFYKDIFEITPDVYSIRAHVSILQVAGTVEVQRMSLVPVILKDGVVYVKLLGFIIWAGMIVWLMWHYFGCLWKSSKVGLLMISFFVVGAMVSGGIKAQLTSYLPTLSYPVTSTFMLDWDALAHFTLFFILAFLSVTLLQSKRWWQVMVELMLLGLFIELLQLFIEGRTADPVDFWVDVTGIVVGGVVAWLWLSVRSVVIRQRL